MEINEKLEVFFGAAIGAANSQSESMLDEQKNIYQSAMEKRSKPQECRADNGVEKGLSGAQRAEDGRIV